MNEIEHDEIGIKTSRWQRAEAERIMRKQILWTWGFRSSLTSSSDIAIPIWYLISEWLLST